MFYLVATLVLVGLVGALALTLSKLNAKLAEVTEKVEPLLIKADEMMTMANEKLGSIGDKTEDILIQGEETAGLVHDKVDRTAVAVQRTIHAPIIGLNSIAAGVARGVLTFGRLQQTKPSPVSKTRVVSPAPVIVEEVSTPTTVTVIEEREREPAVLVAGRG